MTDREFKVGDDVFSHLHGIGKVIIVATNTVRVLFDDNSKRYIYELDGRYLETNKYPSLFHLDEALKLFPMWLEEVEEECVEINWVIYQKSSHCLPICEPFLDKESCEEHIKDFYRYSGIPVEIHLPTKRKIIREKQK